MTRSCVCGGSNSECRWCGGSGIVEETFATALERRSYHPGSESVPPAALSIPIELQPHVLLPTSGDCPFCNAKNVKRLHRHVRRSHGRQQSGEAPDPKMKGRRT